MATADKARPEYSGRTKYDARVADRYLNKAEGRRAAENAILVDLLDTHQVRGPLLDAPCGVARVGALLADRPIDYTAGDISSAMIETATTRLAELSDSVLTHRLMRCDLERMPFAGATFDVSLCLRLLHHLPRPIRARVLTEIARVTERVLFVTFFHPFALHYLERRVKACIKRRPSDRYSNTSGWLKSVLEPSGFQLVDSRGTGFLRETRYAVFERV